MMRFRFGLAAFASMMVVAACSSFAGSGIEPTPDPAVPADASGEPADGAFVVPDARADAGIDAEAPPIFADGFEVTAPGPGCGAWVAHQVSLTTVADVAHGGTNSCRVCIEAPATDPYIERRYDLAVPPSGPLVFEVYVRLGAPVPDASGGGDPEVFATLGFYAGAEQIGFMPASAPVTTAQFQPIQVMLTPTDGGADSARLDVYSTPRTDGRCFYIDDASLYAK